jgi:hypothetical protein
MTLLEAASLRARMWIELTEKILECRANLAGEAGRRETQAR